MKGDVPQERFRFKTNCNPSESVPSEVEMGWLYSILCTAWRKYFGTCFVAVLALSSSKQNFPHLSWQADPSLLGLHGP